MKYLKYINCMWGGNIWRKIQKISISALNYVKNIANHVQLYVPSANHIPSSLGSTELLHSRRKPKFLISFEWPGSDTVVPQVHKNKTCLFKYLLMTPRNHVNRIFRQHWTISNSVLILPVNVLGRPIAQICVQFLSDAATKENSRN